MDAQIIANMNKVIHNSDTLYILGDFSFHPERYYDKIKGKKILLKGNHDSNKCKKYFDEVYDQLNINIGEFKCLLSHYPLNNDRVDFVITAHVHEKWLVNGNNVNIGVDQWNFEPVSEEKLYKFLRDLNDKNRIEKNI
jgi:calcineurin-like phosphoesterase family protein